MHDNDADGLNRVNCRRAEGGFAVRLRRLSVRTSNGAKDSSWPYAAQRPLTFVDPFPPFTRFNVDQTSTASAP
jgi:hypothetical protein